MNKLLAAASVAFFVSGAQAQECVTVADLAAALDENGDGRVVQVVDGVPSPAYSSIVVFTAGGQLLMNRVGADGCIIAGSIPLGPALQEANA